MVAGIPCRRHCARPMRARYRARIADRGLVHILSWALLPRGFLGSKIDFQKIRAGTTRTTCRARTKLRQAAWEAESRIVSMQCSIHLSIYNTCSVETCLITLLWFKPSCMCMQCWQELSLCDCAVHFWYSHASQTWCNNLIVYSRHVITTSNPDIQ